MDKNIEPLFQGEIRGIETMKQKTQVHYERVYVCWLNVNSQTPSCLLVYVFFLPVSYFLVHVLILSLIPSHRIPVHAHVCA